MTKNYESLCDIANLCFFVRLGNHETVKGILEARKKKPFDINQASCKFETGFCNTTLFATSNKKNGPSSYLWSMTPLGIAAAYAKLECLKLLLNESDINVNAYSGITTYYTPLDCATYWFKLIDEEKSSEIQKLLKEKGGKIYAMQNNASACNAIASTTEFFSSLPGNVTSSATNLVVSTIVSKLFSP